MTGGTRAAAADGARVVRVNGPLVEVDGLAGAGHVRHRRGRPGTGCPARSSRSAATWPPSRPTSTPAAWRPATRPARVGEPLSARLGPHLLGGVFDGLLRPLAGAPAWLRPGRTARGHGQASEFGFTPAGRRRAPPSAEGSLLGTVAVRGGIGYRVLVPPGVSGAVDGDPPGRARVAADEVIATVGGQRRAADIVAGRCGARGPTASGWTATRRCSPGSGWSTCCSRSPGAAPPPCPAGSAPARPCCCSRSPSGATRT